MKRENEMISSLKSLHENRLALALEESKKLEAKAAERDSFRSNYYAIREMKERLDKAHATLLEAARDDALATVVKAIYITALEAATLTDNGILLAESMVDDWIRESGGASKILSKVGNDTYLLSRITQIVEDAAEDAVKEVEADDKVEEDSESSAPEVDTNASKEVQIAQLTAKDAELKAQIATLRAEKKAEEENSANDMDMSDSSSDTSSSDTETTDTDTSASDDTKADDSSDTAASDSDTQASDSDTSADTKADESDTTAEPAEDTNSDTSTEEPAADASTDEGESTDTQVASPEEPETDNSDADTSDMSASDDTEATADTSTEEEKPAEDTPEANADADSSDMDTEVDIDSTPDVADDSADEDNDPLADDIDDDEDREADGSTADGELTTDAEPDSEENNPDDDQDVTDALGDPIEKDDTDTDITVDGDTENNGKIFDQLDKEDDVQKAIDLIRTRVADAEETFIRNNAEDKKKIDELLDKISTNVKTVEDLNDKNNVKSKVAEESVRVCKREIEAIREKANLTIFEKMARNVGLGVVKNSSIKESYMTEDGTLDVDLVVETTKVMYGFLETINTLQLEKVNCKYIENVINNMK